jgi:hypothetical protein
MREISRFQVTGVVMMSWAGSIAGKKMINRPKSSFNDRTPLLVLEF